MIINSPVGRFPFEVTSFSRHGTTLVVQGRMGTWPTTVEVTPADIPAVARRARPVLGVVCAAVLAGALSAFLRRH
jgi:hypothetical protein